MKPAAGKIRIDAFEGKYFPRQANGELLPRLIEREQ